MTILSRDYITSDFEAICKLLVESYCITHSLQNWSIRHWEGQGYHRSDLDSFPERPIWVWEDSGKIIGAVHAEYDGSAFFQLSPYYSQLEPNMLAWAEQHLAVSKDEELSLEVWAYEGDKRRNAIFAASGFKQSPFFMNNRRREDNQQTIPVAPMPIGFEIRCVERSHEDCTQIAALLNAAFHRDFHQPEEYANFQSAPHYQPELDLVAVASDGRIVANAQVTIVPENAYAEFEPICTHPDYQHRGIARSLMAEGLRMLRTRGIKTAYVDAASDNPVSNALYEQMGFTDVKRLFLWKKTW
jgi:mycothiol synthase